MVLRSKDCHNEVIMITSLQGVIKRPLEDNSSRWATLGSVIQDCATLRNNNAVEALIGYN